MTPYAGASSKPFRRVVACTIVALVAVRAPAALAQDRPATDGAPALAGSASPPAADPGSAAPLPAPTAPTVPASPSGVPSPFTGAPAVDPAAAPTLPPPPPTLDPAREARASLLRARLRLLNTAIPGLAGRSRGDRIRDGVINLGVGGGLLALSFFVPASPSQDMRPWFWTIAGTQILTGAVGLLWVPARERLGAQFEGMPMNTARERRLRVQFGEQALEDMAADGRRRRILLGVSNGLISVGTLAVIYREPLFNGTPYTFSVFDAVVLGFTGLSLVTNLIDVIQPSQEERLRDSYRSQLRILREERGIPEAP